MPAYLPTYIRTYVPTTACTLICRRSAQLTAEESITKEALLEECVKEPGFRDRLSILSRTFDYRKQVRPQQFIYNAY